MSPYAHTAALVGNQEGPAHSEPEILRTMSIDRPPSELPVAAGEEGAITFAKHGDKFRVLRLDNDTWVIHSRGKSAEQFQLIVKPYGDLWIIEGNNGFVFVNDLGVTLREVFGDKFF